MKKELPSLTKEIVERVVDKMLDLWQTSDQWTQGMLARDYGGQEANPEYPSAARWCAVGCNLRALAELGLIGYGTQFQKLMDHATVIETDRRFGAVTTFNDNDATTYEDMRLFVKCLKDVDPEELPINRREPFYEPPVACHCTSCNPF